MTAPISSYIADRMEAGSWIRRMFERGDELKRRYGEDGVFDLTLGNPVLEPPPAFFEALSEVAGIRGKGIHRYMPNAGFPEVCEAVADYVVREKILPTSPKHVVMCVGAGGGLNVVLKALLDPGDEVIVLAPYFVEYLFYVENHQGQAVVAQTDDRFDPDLAEIDRKITDRTKAIIVNTPNNPTGRVYDAGVLRGLVELLERRIRQRGRPIYLVSDEPYRPIVYGEARPSNYLWDFPYGIFVFSWSKALSIPGDRIGYVAVPRTSGPALPAALVFATRVLGFVNAPATLQKVVVRLLRVTVDVAPYRRKRDLLCAGLRGAGYEFVEPEGAFYLFPRAPVPDDPAFVEAAQEDRVLVVPGSGFGRRGHFRISYCVEDRVVEGAVKALGRVRERLHASG
jgi:aspartate aminotransferase